MKYVIDIDLEGESADVVADTIHEALRDYGLEARLSYEVPDNV